jgi:hypothetical protein
MLRADDAWIEGRSITAATIAAAATAVTTTVAAAATAVTTTVAAAATTVTTAAAVATTATAAAVTTTTAATAVTTAASAWWTSFHRASNVHSERAATYALAMQASDCGLCFIGRAHFHKAEAFGAAGIALHHHFGGLHLAKSGELLLQIFIADGVGKIADVKFVAHDESFSKNAPERNVGTG